MSLFRLADSIELRSNYSLVFRERGKIVKRHESKNIVTNLGRQFMARVITASAFAGAGFTRTSNEIIRYIGFGVGGDRQNSPVAAAAPISTDYAGTNVQTDSDLTVVGLERPVRVNADPLWMTELATPGTFGDPPDPVSTTFTAAFTETDLSYGAYTSVPLSEIGLFKSGADPAEANGAIGGGHLVAYDTFSTIHKTGLWSCTVRWQFRF